MRIDGYTNGKKYTLLRAAYNDKPKNSMWFVKKFTR